MKDENLFKSPESEIVNKIDDFGDAGFFTMTRIRRIRWLAYSSLALVFTLLIIIGIIALMEIMHLESSILMVIIFSFFAIILAIRRLNDMELSGWISIFIIFPYLNVPLVFFLLFAPGTTGENDYGKQPPPNHIGIWLAAIIPFILIAIGFIK